MGVSLYYKPYDNVLCHGHSFGFQSYFHDRYLIYILKKLCVRDVCATTWQKKTTDSTKSKLTLRNLQASVISSALTITRLEESTDSPPLSISRFRSVSSDLGKVMGRRQASQLQRKPPHLLIRVDDLLSRSFEQWRYLLIRNSAGVLVLIYKPMDRRSLNTGRIDWWI